MQKDFDRRTTPTPRAALGIGVLFFVLLFAFPATTHADTTTGLVGWWTLDGRDTTWTSPVAATTLDKSGNGNTGTLVGMNLATSTAVGKRGQALKFNGSSQYVDAGNSSNLQITGNITVSVWFRPSRLPTTNPLLYQFVAKGYDGSNTGYQFGLQNDASTGNVPQLLWASWNGSLHGTGYTYGSNITTNAWYHAVGTHDGTTWKIYLNGSLVASNDDATGPLATTKNVLIGAMNTNPTMYYYPGALDDVRIYNRALSVADIQQLYKTGAARIGASPTVTTGKLNTNLVGYWPLDGKHINWTTGTVFDISGNNNSGSMTNLSTTTSSIPGKVGQALRFNGSNTKITMSNIAAVDNQSNFSISAWVLSKSPQATRQMIFSKGNSLASGAGLYFFLYTGACPGGTCNGTFALVLQENGSNWFEKDTAQAESVFNDGKWHHVVVTLSGGLGGTVSQYIDGINKTIMDGSAGSPTTYTTTQPVVIGSDAGNEHYFDGYIDDVRYFNRTLTQSEALQLYKQGVAKIGVSPTNTLTQGLVGHWTFDGRDTNWTTKTTNDLSGQGNTATMVGMGAATSTTPGKIGQALKFFGGSYTALSDTSVGNFGTGAFTVSAWVKKRDTTNTFLLGKTTASGQSPPFVGWWLYGSTSYSLHTLAGGGTDKGVSGGTVTTNVWQHVVGVRAANGNLTLYVDAVSVGTNPVAANNVSQTTIPFSVGNESIQSYLLSDFAQSPLNGVIDDARIYSRALSASEIQQLYKLGRSSSR